MEGWCETDFDHLTVVLSRDIKVKINVVFRINNSNSNAYTSHVDFKI